MAAKKRQGVNRTAMLKRGRLYLQLFWGFLVLSLLKYIFFTQYSIGHDRRYFIFIFLLVVTTGVIVLFYLWRKRVAGDIRATKHFFYKTVLALLFLLMGIFCSYISVGVVAESIWEIANRRAAANNQEETLHIAVDRFYFGKRPGIGFHFRNRSEKIRCSYRSIAAYRNGPPQRYTINLDVQQGIWGYYIVNSWYITVPGDE